MNIVNWYRKQTFENRTIFMTKISIVMNILLAIAKMILAIVFKNVFFFVAGCVNVLFFLAKLECLLGIMKKGSKYKDKNKITSFFLLVGGIAYIIYMSRLLILDPSEMFKYDIYLGIAIAFVSFVELGVAIFGLFKASGKERYYRNIKMINLCSTITALVWTEIAITSFASLVDTTKMDALFGLFAGIFIVIIAVAILISPKFSIEDRKYINYEGNHFEDQIEIKLTSSKIYKNYYYKAEKKQNIYYGVIKQTVSPIKKWPIWIKIICVILSEILIFAYAFGALIFHIKSIRVFKILDHKMQSLGLEKLKSTNIVEIEA